MVSLVYRAFRPGYSSWDDASGRVGSGRVGSGRVGSDRTDFRPSRVGTAKKNIGGTE